MSSIKRNKDAQCIEDSHAIDNIEYNTYAGGKKVLEIGPSLQYINVTTAEVAVAAGAQLYFYKTTVGVGFVKMSKITGVAVPGAVPAADTFPIQGQVLSPLSSGEYKFVRGTADIHVYQLKDESIVRVNP